MRYLRFISLLALSSLLACQKLADPVTPPVSPPTEPGVVYEKGKPVGPAVQKTIGPEGGSLTSGDGTLSLRIPAGAVASATTFSVQPITATLPGLVGEQAYRLLPEGQTFARPVELQYHYQQQDLESTAAQLLFMAYQGHDGIWKALMDTELDEATRTLTITTTHFSDWGAFARFELEAQPEVVLPGASSNLTLTGYFTGWNVPVDELSGEVALTQPTVLADPQNIKNWKVSGVGSLQVAASQSQATYTAPGHAATSSTLVSVEVYNFLPPKYRPRKGAAGKAVMLKTIQIDGGNLFEATLDGQVYPNCTAAGFIDGLGIVISAAIGDANRPFWLRIRSQKIRASTTIPYKYYATGLDGTAEASLSEGLNGSWVSYVDPCDAQEVLDSPGGVRIDSVELDGRTVSGSLTLTLYNKEDCEISKRQFSAKFKLTLTDG
ncbi:hypothetical protein [Fibrella forsythiae]|uniref:ZU5 domain-containing protein n=1 Tax=Fibrella forsythiae TaxID=2817061 RepID=A0ABS3JRA0_9BACT|nr:hypothetical protein [Fibrella forsythiae]MBO0952524.1 hypothetical protein [Fibrella forsythiae]